MIRDRLKRFIKQLFDKPPVEIEFAQGVSGVVQYGQTILQAAQQLGIEIDHFCGGMCSCSTCVVVVLSGMENLSPIRPKEQLVLGDAKSKRKMRLSCQTKIYGPVHVKIPQWF